MNEELNSNQKEFKKIKKIDELYEQGALLKNLRDELQKKTNKNQKDIIELENINIEIERIITELNRLSILYISLSEKEKYFKNLILEKESGKKNILYLRNIK